MEEVKQKCAGVQLQTEDVYMATTFQDFIQMFVRKLRGEDQEEELVIDYVSSSPGQALLQLVVFSSLSLVTVYLIYFEHACNETRKKIAFRFHTRNETNQIRIICL